MKLGLAPQLLELMACVYGFIALGSLVSLTHPKLRGEARRPMRQAINSWWPPSLLAGLAVALGPWAALAIFAAVSTWCLKEFLALQPEDARNPLVAALAFLTVPITYLALASGVRAIYWGAPLAWILAVAPMARIAAGGPTRATSAARLQLGLLWCVFALSHVTWLFFAAPLPGPVANGGFAAILFVAVMANDAGQYALGKAFGRRPLAPVLSPKKTWEGLLGGVAITAAICALAAPLVTPLSPVQGALVGLALALVGTAGDLMVSALKREAKVKDSGQVLPGQGGLLDRCDSLMFTAPLYAYVMLAWFTPHDLARGAP